MKRKLSAQELEHIASQEGTYSCVCGFTFRGRLDEWLERRAAHWAEAHPGLKVRKRFGQRAKAAA